MEIIFNKKGINQYFLKKLQKTKTYCRNSKKL
jgi:hypothetical protein